MTVVEKTTTDALTGTLWQDFSANILAYIRRSIPDRDDALDIRQDVFLNVYEQLPRLRDGAKLQPWMFRITRNAIADHYRRTYRHRHATDVLAPAQDDPDNSAQNTAFEQELFCCLAPFLKELPDLYRDALGLVMEGKSQQQVADALDISLSGAKSRIQRARTMLQERFMACCHYTLGPDGKLHGDPDCPRCHGVLGHQH